MTNDPHAVAAWLANSKLPALLAATALEEMLKEQGYDKDGTWRFAKAAKSWTTKDSRDQKAWAEVVRRTAPAE